MITMFLAAFGIMLATGVFAIISVITLSFILEMNINEFLKIILLIVLFCFSVSVSVVGTISVLDYVFQSEKQLDSK